MREIDRYCERLSSAYEAEPVNAITNAAILIVAWVIWRRVRGQGVPLANLLIVVLALISVGSFLFHAHAQVWAALADTAPILLFVMIYIFAVNRDICGLAPLPAAATTALSLPYAALIAPLFQ